MINLFAWMLANDFSDWENEDGQPISMIIEDFNTQTALDLFPIVTLNSSDDFGYNDPDVTWRLIYTDLSDEVYPYYIVGYKQTKYHAGIWLQSNELCEIKPAKKILEFTIKDNHEL